MHVLFVCTGNICRSPTAERLSVAYAKQDSRSDFQASSAGTNALSGYRIHDEAAAVIQKLGGDPRNFAARQVTHKLASETDLIITMTKAHRDVVLGLAPRALHRTFTLDEAARLIRDHQAREIADLSNLRAKLHYNESCDIPDPIGHDSDYFMTIGSQIAESVRAVIQLGHRG
ncbi:low molecular weight phosphatase family protein [Mycolicibacterium sp. 050158]|uniref:arsenate reductase/protein-tyrosine-phosphatase family protein n=1 Tax=Mycolicibacterium sp. 050158 TaxID=3090602 RepID=UPI00299D7D32|nr:low molecular weight phosphatase family protein [Mycolicibacterium sp. 050158]MDX1888189.1 low molecular weight phosphatase family protein [Mycolicibacterium sp. 050158]